MDDCPICYEKVDDSTGHCTLSCKHSFHIACLTKWGKDNPSCPMCRKGLGATEIAPRPPRASTSFFDFDGLAVSHRIILHAADAGTGHLGASDFMRELFPAPPPPEGPPPPENRLISIGEGVRVTENDIQQVMEVAHTDRGMAVRALRMYRGDAMDAISWVCMLPPVVHLRPPPPRDPVSEPSDEQATAWFIQNMFREEGVSGYHWNSYSDMVGRTKTTTRNRNEFWMHLQFNSFENEAGYESA